MESCQKCVPRLDRDLSSSFCSPRSEIYGRIGVLRTEKYAFVKEVFTDWLNINSPLIQKENSSFLISLKKVQP